MSNRDVYEMPLYWVVLQSLIWKSVIGYMVPNLSIELKKTYILNTLETVIDILSKYIQISLSANVACIHWHFMTENPCHKKISWSLP
jgi:hypothetical protein